MLTRIVFVALISGALAGLTTSFLQLMLLQPMIVAAEALEKPNHADHGATAAAAPVPAVHAGHGGMAHGADGKRVATTAVATVGAAVGFGLMLLAAMLAFGETVSIRSGLLWGAGGFLATSLAPAFGLPPELPGAASADVTARQLWWVGTAVATALGLLALRYRRWWSLPVAVALIAAPHVIGAPNAAGVVGTVPAGLATSFVVHSLVIQAFLWLGIGALIGHFWNAYRWDATPARPAA